MSPVWESIKSTGAHIAARNISRKLARDPKGTFIKLAELFEKVSVHDVDRERARDMRWLFKNEHVFLDFMERSVTQLAEKPRRALIENFFMNPFVFEGRKKQWQEENGFKPLELLVLSITARCNLHCYGCWAAKYSKKSDDLDYEVLDRLIGEAHNEMGVTLFVLTGGEPFMRKEEMYRLLEKYDKCFFIIYTNSLLITDEDAERLAELGNGAPMISIEGDKATTDARRSNGYDKIISRMELLRDKGVLFGFSGTVTEKNAEYFGSDEFIKLMIDKGCMFGWLFHYIPIGAEPELELILSPEKRDKLRYDVYRMRNNYPIFLADFWNDGYIAHGCLAGGRQYLHVNNNGDIEPCVFAHFAVDNAYETTLTQALQHDFMKAIRGEIPYDGNLLRPCMIIDHPEMLRRHVAEHHARPTHPGAENILERADIIDKLDTNAARWREITEEAVLKGDYMIMYPTRLKPRVPGSTIAVPVTPDEIPEGEAARYAAGLEWAFYHPDSEREDRGVLEESTKLTTDSSDEELSESESLH